MDMQRTEEETFANYFSHERRELISLIPKGPNKVLDVGCAEGRLGQLLKAEGRASFVAGIELNEEAAKVARQNLNSVICADVEKMSLKEPLISDMSFDYILLGDVLEHLHDPWKFLTRIKELLTPVGRIIISIPNVRHISVIIPLVFGGRWTYSPDGILDMTHLRFFTRRTTKQLLEDSGFEVETYNPLIRERRNKIINIATLGLLKDFLAIQWVFTARQSRFLKRD